MTLLADIAKPQYSHWWLPDEASTYAGQIDSLFYQILWATGIAFTLVALLLVFVLIRYRYSATRRAVYFQGNRRLEIFWTLVPLAILLYFAFHSNTLWSEIRDPQKFPTNASVIQIRPKQFEWDITYPGRDRLFGTSDDIRTVNQLYLAVGEPVQIMLEGQDVIHSFFVPEFRIKQDAVPGLPTSIWIQPTKIGSFDISCAELCGMGHYSMQGTAYVMSRDSIDAWITSRAEHHD